MTNKELSQIFYIKKETEITEKRIEDLKNIINDLNITKSNNDDFLKMQKLETKLKLLKDELYLEMNKIQDYINNVDDSLVRLIITLRCIDCYSWDEVSIAIGGGNSYDSIKKIYYRYIKNN